MLGVFLCLRELVRSSGVATILLFQKTSQRFYYLGLVETMSLLTKRKKAAAASDAFNAMLNGIKNICGNILTDIK